MILTRSWRACRAVEGALGHSHWRQHAPDHSFSNRRNLIRRYADHARQETPPGNRSRRIFYRAAAFLAGAAIVNYSADIKHVARGAQRAGRVAVTLFLNIKDYRNALKHRDDDPDEYAALLKACHQTCANRTFVTLEKNGSIFIKLGQHLTSLNYLLPNEWCDTMIPLQDKCPVSSFESIEQMVEKDTGQPLSDYFSDFETQPIGAASLAQVHLATLKTTGERVAVKVQHPALDEWADMDLTLTRWTFTTLKKWFPEYDLTWLSEEMQASLPKELDFALEGRNADAAREYFSHVRNTPLIIPRVHWARRRILVMEFVTGHRPDDLEYLDANGIDRDEVSAALARIFNEMIFGKDAPLHCDPHGGNIAIRLNESRRQPHNFDVILYDHGLYRNPPLTLRRNYAKMWLAVIDVDLPAMRKYAYEIGGVTDEQFPIFASAVTGRDFTAIQNSVSNQRDEAEKQNITDALGDGLLEQIVTMLGQVPRVILLILKTNDLTRSLDENLHTRQGPIRTIMILAQYASRAVYEEQLENLRGSLLAPKNLWAFTKAWTQYHKIVVKLTLYEYWLRVKAVFGYRTEMMNA